MPRLSSKIAKDAKVDGLIFEFLKTANTRASVQSDTEWNCAKEGDNKVLYYEINILAIERGGAVGVGIAAAGFPVSEAQPGWYKESYGYHGDDGTKFESGSLPSKFGPTFGQGDVVGTGLDTSTGELFFTKNGKLIGVAAKVDKAKRYFPTVGTNRKSKIKFNFDGPFSFTPKKQEEIKTETAPAPAEQKPVAEHGKEEKKAESKEEKKEESKEEKKAEEKKPVVEQKPAPVPAPAWAPANQSTKGHIMLSYQWGSQEFVKIIYKELTAQGYVVWMDIEGGMRGDIYQSMAEGVEGSVVFVPLLTAKYMASPNCRRECTAATDMRKTFMPMMCENFEISGWLRACLPGQLWYPCFDHKISPETLKNFLGDMNKTVPVDSPARKPNLSIYISYAHKNKREAEVIKKKLEEEKPPYDCIMSAEEKSVKKDSGSGTPRGEKPAEGEKDLKKGDGKLKKGAELEEKLRNAKAVILILSSDFESSDECKNDVSLSYSYRKVIIPIIVKPLKGGYPPKDMEFALKPINSLDFISLINKPSKHSTIARKLSDALTTGAVAASSVPQSGSSKNFRIKNVGTWTENDVTNWLTNVGLSQYSKDFKKKHVDGRVLLNLQEKDLDSLGIMKLHQRRFFGAISELFNGLNWNEDEVAEWMDRVGLSELAQNLYDAHINGQSLLMLTENDLQGNKINDPVTQKRILIEIQHLKETNARVPIQDEHYRFKVLRDVLKPVPTDSTRSFKFSEEALELIKQIYNDCDEEGQGLTQIGLMKFLLLLLVTSGVYHDSYPTKTLWTDTNMVEVISLKKLAHGLADVMDATITELEEHLGESQAAAELDEMMQEKMLKSLCFNYVILKNILQRLFAIIDRQVDGVVSWTELLPCLELIVHGATEDKFKLAMCLVDFNGDGDISQAELLEFYTECFLPLVRFCRKTNLVEDFNTLSKNSFLYLAYDAVKDVVDKDQVPTLLNKQFIVEEFSGFLTEQPYEGLESLLALPWDNSPLVCFPYGYHPHPLVHKAKSSYSNGGFGCDGCSQLFKTEVWHCEEDCTFDLCPDCYKKRETAAKARNIDIVLKYKSGSFTLSHLCLGGRFNASAFSMVKNALLWVSDEQPDIKSYSAKYDDFTPDKEIHHEHKPIVIKTDPAKNYLAYVNLDTPLAGKYVHIKLIDTYTEAEVIAAKEAKKKLEQEEKSRPAAKPEGGEEAKEDGEGEKGEGEGDGEEGEGEEGEEGEGEEGEEGEGDGEEGEGDGEGEGEGEGDDEEEEEEEEVDDDDNLDAETKELLQKCIVAEFVGLWGFNGKQEESKGELDAKKLFTALSARYDTYGDNDDYGSEDFAEENKLEINSFVTEFLKTAKDIGNGAEELSSDAIEKGIEKKDVEDLFTRLNFLTSTENPVTILTHILPIIHLFRLFYGHSIESILKEPM